MMIRCEGRSIWTWLGIFLLASGSARGANFWLSTSDDVTAGSAPPSNVAGTPTLAKNVGDTGTLYIWGAPDTDKTLENWSLRVASSKASAVTLSAASVEEYNPLGVVPSPFAWRWEYTREPAAATVNGERSELQDLQGFRAEGFARFAVGIGATASADFDDQNYHAPTKSWLLASFQYQCVGAATADIFLQIGAAGASHFDESSADTFVVLGATDEGLLNAETQRLTDTPREARIVVTAAVPNGDFDGDDDKDGADFLIWQRGLGRASDASRATGDANNDGAITAADLAVWRAQYAGGTTPGAQTVPEPRSAWAILAAAWLVAGSSGRLGGRHRGSHFPGV